MHMPVCKVYTFVWSPWHQPIKFASLIGNCNVLKALLGFDSWVNFGTIEFSKYISKKIMFSTCSPTKKTHRPQNLLFEKQNRLCDLNCGGRCANTFFLERNMQFSSLNTWYSQVWACGVSEPMIFPWFTRMPSAYCILLPSQGVEPCRLMAVKVSLPGRHPVELVVPRHQFFGPLFLVVGPWDGNQRQGGHWCRYHLCFLYQQVFLASEK